MGFLSIDPGVHTMALAAFHTDGSLIEAWNEPSNTMFENVSSRVEGWGSPSVRLVNRLQAMLPDEGNTGIVGERQVVYPGAKGLKTNPNDLLDLAMCAGAFYGALCVDLRATLRLVEPAEWKAQVPKEITRERIKAILTPQEIGRIRKGGEMHNVWDAIGIGLFACGRAKRGMVR
jgi:hypothetical protein